MNTLDYHRTPPPRGRVRRRRARGIVIRLNVGVFLLGCSVLLGLLVIAMLVSAMFPMVDPPAHLEWKRLVRARGVLLAFGCMMAPLTLWGGLYLIIAARSRRSRRSDEG
jgi:hypothetical protein